MESLQGVPTTHALLSKHQNYNSTKLIGFFYWERDNDLA